MPHDLRKEIWDLIDLPNDPSRTENCLSMTSYSNSIKIALARAPWARRFRLHYCGGGQIARSERQAK